MAEKTSTLVCPVCHEPVLRRFYYLHVNLHQGGRFYDEQDHQAQEIINKAWPNAEIKG